MSELNIESVNDRINDFISGLPFPLVACRLMLLIVHLLEELQDQGREAEIILRDFIIAHEESRDDPDQDGYDSEDIP